MSSYTGKNGMLSRDITFFTDEAFEVFSLLYDFEVRRELMPRCLVKKLATTMRKRLCMAPV